jgi:hypothetical protein
MQRAGTEARRYMGRKGLEPPVKPPEKPHVSQTGGAKSGASGDESGAQLAKVARAWPGLPETSKAAIVKIVYRWTHDGKAAGDNLEDSAQDKR